MKNRHAEARQQDNNEIGDITRLLLTILDLQREVLDAAMNGGAAEDQISARQAVLETCRQIDRREGLGAPKDADKP